MNVVQEFSTALRSLGSNADKVSSSLTGTAKAAEVHSDAAKNANKQRAAANVARE